MKRPSSDLATAGINANGSSVFRRPAHCGPLGRGKEAFMSRNPEGRRTKGFTIIELLVVVSIIALLIGILLPAIQKARDSARVTQSRTNLRNIGAAHASYSADFNDRQWTLVRDDLAAYVTGNVTKASDLCTSYVDNAGCHPAALIGYMVSADGFNGGGFYLAFPPCEGANGGAIENCNNMVLLTPTPIWSGEATRLGCARLNNVANFTTYMNNRYYDPVFWAPKDKLLLESAEKGMQNPGGMSPEPNPPPFPSYCLSAAAMYSPDVLAKASGTGSYNINLPGRFRAPPVGAARYSELKTRSLEHSWLQNANVDSNPALYAVVDGVQMGVPFYYTAAATSAPVCLFFDGHVDLCGVYDAIEADSRVKKQEGLTSGLWCRSIPTWMAGGYYTANGACPDYTYQEGLQTGYHMFTVGGIVGRDVAVSGQ
jgi:prepilin-type N-terminal cleavage/methylation domain-containing protein